MLIGDKLHNLEDLIGIKDCDGLSGPKEIMRRAEMQYDVVKDDLGNLDRSLDGYYAVKRTDNNHVFNIVRGNYEVIQTEEILNRLMKL